MPVDVPRLVGRMKRFPGVLRAAVADLPDADARWRPADGAWSIIEIVRHIGDEEVEDFRTRVKRTLDDPAALDRFESERRRSIEWIEGLGGADWSRTHEHPKIGAMRAGDVMVSWAAHDALHLRQIAKRMYQLTARDGGTYGPDYAGTWRA